MSVAVIFGGTGFIGSYFAEQLVRDCVVDKVILADIAGISHDRFDSILLDYIRNGSIIYSCCDVRRNISEQLDLPDGSISLIANFAAIHREPGHENSEYYDTNLPGAENVCKWASEIGCENIIFTSSIAPYGPSELPKDEGSIPAPVSGYGGSKLAAEKIHLIWKNQKRGRNLTIVRPGVVFGAGEGGNVSRLIKATVKGYFFYMGNQQTRKAGTYVRELTNAMWWVHSTKTVASADGHVLFNMTMDPAPSVKEYVDTIRDVSGSNKKIFAVPYGLLYPISFVVEGVAKVFGVSQPISPVRMRKLVRSNYIVPKFLSDNGYSYKYTLREAMEEWKSLSPREW